MAANILLKTEDFIDAVAWDANASVFVALSRFAPPAFAGPRAARAGQFFDASDAVQASLFATFQSISADSSAWTASIHVRKDANETRFGEIDIQLAGGTGRYGGISFNSATGAVANSVDGAPDASGVIDVDSLWWRFWCMMANNGTNTVGRMGFFPSRSSTLGGSPEAVKTDSNIFWGANLTNDATPAVYDPEPFYLFQATDDAQLIIRQS